MSKLDFYCLKEKIHVSGVQVEGLIKYPNGKYAAVAKHTCGTKMSKFVSEDKAKALQAAGVNVSNAAPKAAKKPKK